MSSFNNEHTRQKHNRSVLRELKIGKESFCEILNAPESEYYRWISSDLRSNDCIEPNLTLIIDFCLEFGISPNYLLLGVGEKWLCDIDQKNTTHIRH
jgi:hypothetical protein